MKLTLATNRSYKITIPKSLIKALQWKNGDNIDVLIKGKDILLKNNA